jgi:hypothetical protein
MYTAEKENKVYTISELEVEYYQNQGFDIYNSEHELHARGVKASVSGAVYNAALEEIEKLKAEIEELSKKKKGE